MNKKIIVLDFGIFMHRAIYASRKNSAVHPCYTCFSMMIGNLKKIGVNEGDKIIIAMDHLSSWRKDYAEEYKADRAQKRKESGIDFDTLYKDFNLFTEELEIATDWHFIKIPHFESDDIMAVASRFYKDKEVILVTYDTDLEQCWEYENVKIFSPMTKKWKVKPPKYNPHMAIAKKAEKERADNLISPILTEEDFETRMICVNLLQLPEWVEEAIVKKLNALEPEAERLDAMPYPTSLGERYNTLKTDKSKLIDYDKQVAKELKKKEKKKAVAKEKKK